jgi:LmbE family N-acetylglucosaminyl deacetylase
MMATENPNDPRPDALPEHERTGNEPSPSKKPAQREPDQESARTGPAFDPAQRGTAESVWRDALDAIPAWTPTTGRLLVVSPHPDDEVLGAGGLIRQWVDSGLRVTLLNITDGEAAYPDWPALDRVRRVELERALTTLCGNAMFSVGLRVPDGRVGEHAGRLRAALAALVDHDTTIVAPYEADGHPDHDAAGAICREFAQSTGRALARYPIWAWHHRSPANMRVRWGKFPLQPQTRRAKAAAARCFTSQLRPERRAPIIPAHVMSYFSRPFEAFVL